VKMGLFGTASHFADVRVVEDPCELIEVSGDNLPSKPCSSTSTWPHGMLSAGEAPALQVRQSG